MQWLKRIFKKEEKQCYYFWDALNLCWITGCLGILRIPDADKRIPVKICPFCGGKIISNHVRGDAK